VIARDVHSRPILCLVTDRRRLAERLAIDSSGDAILERLVAQAAEAADAGVDWIQYASVISGRASCPIWSIAWSPPSGAREGHRQRSPRRCDRQRRRGVHLGERSVPADRARAGSLGRIFGRRVAPHAHRGR
jgi:hypothetical protein